MFEWKPKVGGLFWAVTSTGEVVACTYAPGTIDDERWAIGNCYKTREEAAEKAEAIKKLFKTNTKITKQKPKLTVEVFDREDCPAWAKWVAVDEDGEAFYYESEPEINDGIWINSSGANVAMISDGYDNSDYKHSLIKRPEKVVLPDWVKPDAIGWHAEEGYFHIFSIDSEKSMAPGIYFRRVKYSTNGFFLYRTFVEECSEARHIVDAEDLVGKKVRRANDVVRLITRCDANIGRVDLGDLKGIPIGALTTSKNYQLIGELKFKYQHKEDGEWVD